MSKYFSSTTSQHAETILEKSVENNDYDHIPKYTETKPINNTITDTDTSINEAIQNIEKKNGREVNNSFKNGSSIEIIERLNQIVYLLIEFNNRLTTIERHLNNDKESNKKSMEVLDEINGLKKEVSSEEILNSVNSMQNNNLSPREQFERDIKLKNNIDLNTVDGAKKYMATATADNKTPIEDIFPEMPDEAIQASYAGKLNN